MAMRSAPLPTVAHMRSVTLICALAASLHFLSSDVLAAGGWTWPVRGPVITSYRNGSDPYAAGQHRGIDIGAAAGTRVVAAAGGTVTFAGVVGSSGLTVSERTADGRFDLSYLHLSSVAVHRGDSLEAGAVIGAVGTSGRRSAAAPHLHFGVREAGRRTAYRDPLDFLAPPPAGNAPEPAPAPVRVAHPAAAQSAPAPAPAAAAAAARPGLPRVPLALPGRSPSASRRPHLAPRALPLLPVGRNAAGAPRPHPFPAHERPGGARPGVSPARGPAGAPQPAHASREPMHTSRGQTGSHGHGGRGIDLGWLAACLGLIAAATALGRPDTARKLALQGRARFGALLRPASRAAEGGGRPLRRTTARG
jgi:peptidase M23-like protein